jgi:hypothetical protein
VTSQIAIFNPLGVAVASDTVITISGERGRKTTNNAQKMWELGAPHLIVVIQSGAVPSNGVHTQLLIREWSRTLKEQLPTVEDYARSFADWFTAAPDIVPTESELREIHLQLNDHYYEVRRRVAVDTADTDDPKEIAECFEYHARSGFDWLSNLENFAGVTDEDDAELLEKVGVDLNEKLDIIFEGVPGLDEAREILLRSAPLVLSRVQPSDLDTDLGFIGFGAEEYFAKSVRVSCRARYGDVARLTIENPFGATAESQSGSIATFAQEQAISGFLRGAQYDVMESAFRYVWGHLSDGIDDEDQLNETREFMRGLRQHVDKFQMENFVSPMLDTIGALSLTDVANLASSLVGMQAIRAAASPEPASVGGYIESLVIDRAEGIRWIQRLPR